MYVAKQCYKLVTTVIQKLHAYRASGVHGWVGGWVGGWGGVGAGKGVARHLLGWLCWEHLCRRE